MKPPAFLARWPALVLGLLVALPTRAVTPTPPPSEPAVSTTSSTSSQSSTAVAAPATSVPSPVAAPRPNVLFITFDTLRRDHVSCYGSERLTTPRLDAMAARGVKFTDCQSVVPITGPSHASMLSGLYPQVHGAFRNGVPMKEGVATLAEILRAEGYRTGAVVSGWTLKARQCGLDRGFETYDDSGMEDRYSVVNLMRRADAVTDAALAWHGRIRAESPAAPWMLFVHYFDPHEPYDLTLADVPPPNPGRRTGDFPTVHRDLLPEYDREIAFADREMGRLLDRLAATGELDRTLFVFTADHGQSFGEHGYGGPEGAHGRRVYQGLMASPLVVAGPGVAAGRTADLPVSHLDLMPTVASLVGAGERVPAAVAGHDLARVLADPAADPPWGRARRVRYGLAYRGAVGNKWNIFRWAQNKQVEQAFPLYACAVLDGRKLIVDMQKTDRIEMFDLAKDPDERVAIDVRATREAGEWARELLAWYDRTRTDLTAAAPSGSDLENLRSLGYVE